MTERGIPHSSEMIRSAVISEDGLYRYELRRQWDQSRSFIVWCLLNPSTANADRDDPTVRRCIGFSQAWGHGGLIVVNLMSYRATRPQDCLNADDPYGPLNHVYLDSAASRRPRVMCAWGSRAPKCAVEIALRYLPRRRLFCLGITKDGSPRHPLYVRAEQKPILWRST